MDEPVARLRSYLPLLLALGVLAVYLPGLSGGFVFDDQVLVLRNSMTDSLTRIPEMFRVGLWESVDGLEGAGKEYYRPLMLVSLAVDRAIGGFSPLVAHAQNLGWHLLSVGLLYRLLHRILEDRDAAVLGAGLFAVHPAQVEAVQWISARNDPMAAVFLLASLSLLSEQDRPVWRTALGGLCALAALLCKESAALSPLLLVLVNQARGRGWGDRWGYLSLGGATAVYLGLRAWAGAGAVSIPFQNLPLALLPALTLYAERLVWTGGLPPILAITWAPPPPVWALVLLGALVVVVLALGRRLAVLGLLFAGLTWAPCLGGLLVTGEAASRYLYLPMVGLGLALGAAFKDRPAAPAVALVSLLGLTLSSATLLPRWRDDEALWTTNLELWPTAMSHGAYAKYLEEQGRLDEAAEHYRRATSSPPTYMHSCFNITSINIKRNDPVSAVRDGEAALAAGCAPSPELLGPLSVAQAVTGDWDGAEATASRVGADPTGKAILVRLAAAARRGDWGPIDAEVERAGPQSAPALAVQLTTLLELAQEPAVADAVRAHLNVPAAP